MDAEKAQPVYVFGQFRLDAARGSLTHGDIPIPLNSRAFELLSILVAHHGEVVSKNAIMAAVWPGSVVEEGNLTVHMSALRRALGDTRDGQGHIVTVPGRGYRFVTPVKILDDDGEAVKPSVAPLKATPTFLRAPRPLIVGSVAGILILSLCIVLWRSGGVVVPRAATKTQPLATSSPTSRQNFYTDVDPKQQDRRQTLIVLPFDDDIGGQSQLAATITNQVTDRLLSWMIGTPLSAAQLKAEKVSAPEIARRLNLHFIVTGAIERSPDGYFVHYSLIDAPNDQLVLNRSSRPAPSDLRSTGPLLDEIAHNVQLRINRLEVANIGDRPPDARDWVIRAQAEYGARGVNRAAILNSLDYLDKALALKPDYEPALRYDSRERAFATIFHWLPDDAAALARAEAENQPLLERMPANGFFQFTKSLTLIAAGRLAEAMSRLELSYEPNGPVINTWMLGRLRAQAGRLEEAKALLEEADRNEDWDKIWDVQASLAAVDLALGRDEEAVARARKAVAMAIDAPIDAAQSWLVIASVEALRGDAAGAEEALGSYRALQGPIPPSASEFARAITPRFAQGLRKAGFGP